MNKAIDTVWVAFAGCLVLLMQGGFAMLEVGLTRMKNAGAVAAKVLVNLAFSFAAFWAIGYAFAFGDGNGFIGASGWFLEIGNADGVQSLAYSVVDEPMKFFFQATFAAVALAIVWGTTLDRIRFGAYLPFALLFVGVIYPIVAHWVWGGGWLSTHFQASPARAWSTSRGLRGRSLRPCCWATDRQVPRRQAPAAPRSLDATGAPRHLHPVGRVDGLQPGSTVLTQL